MQAFSPFFKLISLIILKLNHKKLITSIKRTILSWYQIVNILFRKANVHVKISNRGFIMKILEVRDSFIKFESEEKQDLSSFLEVKDSENKYIAQVVKTSKNDDKYISYAKVLFLYDGTFNPLKGKTPRVDASIVNFPFEIIQESFKVEEPISLGTYLNSTKKINIDKNALNRSFLASIDTPAKISDFVTNVAKNFDKSKVLVIDMLGVMNSSIKYKASVDFKLPLNSDSLDFI